MRELVLLGVLWLVCPSVLAGFAPGVVDNRATSHERTKGNDIHSEAMCKRRRGEWVGQKGYEYCVLPYADAGKICRTSKECVGHCIAPVPDASAEPPPSHGTCQVNDDPDDCGRPHFESGKVIYFNCD